MDQLNRKAFLGLAQLTIILAPSVFVPAGTINYWQGWVFLSVFFISSLLITVYLMNNDPKLLERRVKGGPTSEKEKSQKIIQAFASLTFLSIIIFPALDYRFRWSFVPVFVALTGDALIALGFGLVFLVFRENTFTSAIIEVDEKQKVIATGPYSIVRHPMYAGALVLLCGIPLALGSCWGLFALMPLTLIIIWRLLDEEKFLTTNLTGYLNYQEKVKYRLVPFVW